MIKLTLLFDVGVNEKWMMDTVYYGNKSVDQIYALFSLAGAKR